MYVLVTLLFYWGLMYLLSKRFVQESKDKDDLLGAGKNFSWKTSALAITSMWIWAPALFTSSFQGYQNGWVGLFWFTVPNVLTLLIFIPFAKKLKSVYPKGHTLVGWMEQRYSRRVKILYLIVMSVVTILSSAVQLMAGANIISMNTPLPYWIVVILLGLMTMSYTRNKGLRISVYSDVVKAVVLLVGAFSFALILLYHTGVESLLGGIQGVSEVPHFFSDSGWFVFFSFGLSTSVGLISGTFGDQSFWQLSQSTKASDIGRAFKVGAGLFALVPILLGSIGFMAVGSGFEPVNAEYVNMEILLHYMPNWILIPFAFFIFSGLLSTLDSNTASISALVNEVTDSEKAVFISPLVLIVGAVLIAIIPGTFIGMLFLLYGTVRATTTAITMITLKSNRISLREPGVFWGILASIAFGVPVYLYGNLNGLPLVQSLGSILALVLSGLVAILYTKWDERA